MVCGPSDAQTVIGHYSVIRIRTTPAVLQTVGVLLVDGNDQLHFRLSDVILSHDEDILAVWEATAEMLGAMAEDLGGMGVLRSIEEMGSNFMEISSPITVQMSDAKVELMRLYDQYVLPIEVSDRSQVIYRVSRSTVEASCSLLPNISADYVDIIRKYKNGDLGLQTLEQFLERNPTIAGQIVRLANSVAYSRGAEIRSIRQALSRVGTDAAFGFIVALSLRPLYSSPTVRKIWNLSIQCRQAALAMALNCKIECAEEIGLLALVADVGKVVLFTIPGFEQHYAVLRSSGYPVLACETMLLGTTHAEISAAVLQNWAFPHDMIETIRFHHRPAESSSRAAALLYTSECSIESFDAECDLDQYYAAAKRLQIFRGETKPRRDYASEVLAYSS